MDSLSSNRPHLPSDSTAKIQAAATVLRGIAFVFANVRTYGVQHNITQQAMSAVAQALEAFHKAFGAFSFELKDNTFYAAGAPLNVSNAALELMAKHFVEIGARDFVFEPGISPFEIVKWFTFLSPAAGNADIASAMQSANFSKIKSGAFHIVEIASDEDVAKKEDIAAIGRQRNASPLKNAARLLDSVPDGEPMPALKINLEDREIFDDLRALIIPPDETGTSSIEARESEYAEEAFRRMERLSEGLLANPANQTSEARSNLGDILKAAGDDIIERLSRLGSDIQVVEELSRRVKELVENIAVDGIVARYASVRGEMLKNGEGVERRIREVIADDDVKKKITGNQLFDPGVTEDVLWELLDLAEKDNPGKHGPGGSYTGETTPLSSMLTQLKSKEKTSADIPQLVEGILGEMTKSLKNAEERAHEQLKTLRKVAEPAHSDDSDKANSSDDSIPRNEILGVIAELGQQLRQPLTVVSGASEMLSGGYLGVLPKHQNDVLKLIFDSASELDILVGRLIRIAGLPDSLNPNMMPPSHEDGNTEA